MNKDAGSPTPPTPSTRRTTALTAAAMLAFAANSILCRLALQRRGIDPASFSSIRLVSGAVVLALAVRLGPSASMATPRRDWLAAVALFAYVVFFSFAYLDLSAGTGALILFGAVQLTMLSAGLRAGERFGVLPWIGLLLAAGGLVYLVSSGITTPSPPGAASMAIAGLAWGIYSLRGRGIADPLAATSRNFTRAAPLALILSLGLASTAHADGAGIALAVASGALTSGIGYVLWYAALRGLPALSASIVQLSVPLIAAFGGVLFLSEALTWHLVVAAAAILGGIALALTRRAASQRP